MPGRAVGGTAEPSALLRKMRLIFLFGWTLFYVEEGWIQAASLYRCYMRDDHLLVIVSACMIVGCTLLAILGLCNLVYLRNPKSRLYLFRWMST